MSPIAELQNCRIAELKTGDHSSAITKFNSAIPQFRNSAICKIHFSSLKNRKYEQDHSAVGMLPRGRAVKITL